MKHKWEKSDSHGQETGQVKHQCSGQTKGVKSYPDLTEAKEEFVSPKTVAAKEVMDFPSISTRKWVTMVADDFKSLMNFVRYIK